MKKFMLILSISSAIILFGVIIIAIIAGTIKEAFRMHVGIGVMVSLFWTMIISFLIYEKLENHQRYGRHNKM
jgi:hypothetical protein